MRIASVEDYREAARRRLPPFLFEYIDGGSYDQATLERNRTDLKATQIRQLVLRDVSAIDTDVELFGERFALPFGLAPVGLAGMYARRGERQAVRAAEAAGMPMALSTMSCCALEEVAAAAKRPFWFQLYMIRDRGFMAALIARVRGAGCSALVLTVDLPLPGSRYRDVRSGMTGGTKTGNAAKRFWQAATHPRWAWDVGLWGRPHSVGSVAAVLGDQSGLEDFLGWIAGNFDPSVTWRDLDFIRQHWPGPLILKGILDPADAREAASAGVDGIVVSNHGGRQLDGVPSSAAALPAIRDLIGDAMTVLADSGVRSGLDVFKLLALGADGVLLGRAWAYALAARGEAGVRHMAEIMRAELKIAMALSGATSIAQIDSRCLVGEAQ